MHSFIKKGIAFIFSVLFVFNTLSALAAERYGVVVGSVVNFRAEPSLSGQILTQVNKGTYVNVHSVEGTWIKATYNNMQGYFHTDYVAIRDGAMPSRSTETARTSTGNSVRDSVVATAKKYLGVRYRYGGASPSGFDCSGFTYYVFGQNGINLSRTSSGQASNGTYVSRANLLPGDIIIFSNSSSRYGHAAVYVGNGQIIHSPNSSSSVKYDTINSGWYNSHYVTARRVIN